MSSLRFQYSPHEQNFSKKLKLLLPKFEEYRNKIMKIPFANLPWQDVGILSHIQIPKGCDTVVLCGIGGSSLGAKTITHALGKHSIVYLNNIDPDFIHEQLQHINPQKTVFLIMSKSGETIEVLTLTKLLFSKISSRKRFLIVTDDKNSSLGRLALKEKIPVIQSPEKIPGRFSGLSVVGLLPASLMKISAEKILLGARKSSWKEAYILACHQYIHYRNKKNITSLFPYCEALAAFADWYIQLLAESIGKTKQIGITPIKAMGVKDQHSQLQLFLDGPDDKFYIFLKPQESIHKSSLQKLFNAEYLGVKGAFKKRKKPFVEISFPKISEETLGELLFSFELEVAFLGMLFGINFENQPAVELSKKLTRSILKKI